MGSRYTIEAVAFTTRTVRLTTGEYVSFAPEALRDALKQVQGTPIPVLTEHLSYLPPLGMLSDGEIRRLEDGDQQLILFGNTLDHALVDLQSDPFLPNRGSLRQVAASVDHVEMHVEPRNFPPETYREARVDCPIEIREQSKWAGLPPIEWLVVIPVTWGAAKFAGSFLEHLGDAAGEATVKWIKRVARRVRRGDRHQFVTLSFENQNGAKVLGFIPFQVTEDATEPPLETPVDTAGFLAEVAGTVEPSSASTIAYLYTDREWQLAWWVDGGGVCISTTFADRCPNPERFL